MCWWRQEGGPSSAAIKCDGAAIQSEQCSASIWQPCQDNSEVTESLLPSCCLARGATQEANVVLFLEKSLIMEGGRYVMSFLRCAGFHLLLQNSIFPTDFLPN